MAIVFKKYIPPLECFGDGHDGVLNVTSGTVTLTGGDDIREYTRVIVASGAVLVTAGKVVCAKEYIEINGTVRNNGSNGGSSGGRGAPGSSKLGSGGRGGGAFFDRGYPGGLNDDGNTVTSISSSLGAQLNLGAGSGGSGDTYQEDLGGPEDDGGGGGGGGEVELWAPIIRGSGLVQAKGGSGRSLPGPDGASGGGGGRIRIFCVYEEGSLTYDVSGGARGDANAQDGAPGLVRKHILLQSPD